MANLITKGEAVAGKLTATTDVEATDDLIAGDDLTVADDAAVTGDLTAGTLAVGASGSVIKKIATGTASVNLPSINNLATGSATFTLSGAASGDVVVVNPPTLTSGLAFVGAAVTAADTVTVYALNASGGTIDEAAGTYRYLWIDLT